jgi:hypothetical protein
MIASANSDTVARPVRCLPSTRRQVAAFLHAGFSFPSPGARGFLCKPSASWHVSKMLFSTREHLASHWLDLAEGRLRLDRLNRNGVGETFFPWACHPARKSAGTPVRPFLARQESLADAILRCAAARVGAASIAFGFQIAIEAAVVAELENSKEK